MEYPLILGYLPKTTLQQGEIMGQNMGQLISKFGANIWDIDIKNLAVSLIKQTGCKRKFEVLKLLTH